MGRGTGAVGSPDLNLADVDHVLEGLISTCFYLNTDHNRYRFGLAPNLNQILVTRRGAVQDKEIDKAIKDKIQALFARGPKEIDRRFFPARSNDVPNRPVLTLVVLGLDNPVGSKSIDKLMESIVRERGTSGRTYKSGLIFAVPDAPENIRDATRNFLAWEAIIDDDETKQRLEDVTEATAGQKSEPGQERHGGVHLQVISQPVPPGPRKQPAAY